MKNILRKGDIACNKQFLVFSQCFPAYIALIFHFKRTLILSQTTYFRLAQTERVHNFNFKENSRKVSKWVENTVRKGEIVHYELFLLFPQCFQKTCSADTEKPGLVWERVKMSSAI